MDADNFRRIFGEFRFKYSLILRQQDLNPSRLSEYVLLFFLYFIEIRMRNMVTTGISPTPSFIYPLEEI